MVQQDSFLFTTSIENNIAYGNPWAREQRIERAAEFAQLHNYIIGLAGRLRPRWSASAASRCPAASGSACRSRAA